MPQTNPYSTARVARKRALKSKQPTDPRRYLRRFYKTHEVMAMCGYQNRTAFHQMVKSRGLPYIRLNARSFLYGEDELNEWLRKHSSGGQ